VNQIQFIIHTTDKDEKKLIKKLLKIKSINEVWFERWVFKEGNKNNVKK